MATGTIVGYAYTMEFFIAYYGGNPYELDAFINRAFGDYWWAYISMFSCNVFFPQLFWFRKIRSNILIVFIVSIFVNIGMWFERFVIVMTLHYDFLPANWGYYEPTIVDILTFVGTFGMFMFLFLLFLKFLPMIAISEVKNCTPYADPHEKLGGHKEH